MIKDWLEISYPQDECDLVEEFPYYVLIVNGHEIGRVDIEEVSMAFPRDQIENEILNRIKELIR